MDNPDIPSQQSKSGLLRCFLESSILGVFEFNRSQVLLQEICACACQGGLLRYEYEMVDTTSCDLLVLA